MYILTNLWGRQTHTLECILWNNPIPGCQGTLNTKHPLKCPGKCLSWNPVFTVYRLSCTYLHTCMHWHAYIHKSTNLIHKSMHTLLHTYVRIYMAVCVCVCQFWLFMIYPGASRAAVEPLMCMKIYRQSYLIASWDECPWGGRNFRKSVYRGTK